MPKVTLMCHPEAKPKDLATEKEILRFAQNDSFAVTLAHFRHFYFLPIDTPSLVKVAHFIIHNFQEKLKTLYLTILKGPISNSLLAFLQLFRYHFFSRSRPFYETRHHKFQKITLRIGKEIM
jgi:hypothetical protein